MSKQNVMIHDVEETMILVDEKVEEIRRRGLPLHEMTELQCYEIRYALNTVFINSAFADLPNGLLIFDRVWAAVENNENRETSLDDDDVDDSLREIYRRFCAEAEPYLDVARMAAMLD